MLVFVQTLTCRLDASHEERLVTLVNTYRSPQAPAELLVLRGVTDSDAYVVVAVFASQEEAAANEHEPSTLQFRQAVEQLTDGVTYQTFEVLARGAE
jgi:precorrin-6B methylase 1